MHATDSMLRFEPATLTPLSLEEPAGSNLKVLMADYERTLILHALAESGGHQRRAAASLGLLPTTLLEKMKRLGIRRTRQEYGVVSRTAIHLAAERS